MAEGQQWLAPPVTTRAASALHVRYATHRVIWRARGPTYERRNVSRSALRGDDFVGEARERRRRPRVFCGRRGAEV